MLSWSQASKQHSRGEHGRAGGQHGRARERRARRHRAMASPPPPPPEAAQLETALRETALREADVAVVQHAAAAAAARRRSAPLLLLLLLEIAKEMRAGGKCSRTAPCAAPSPLPKSPYWQRGSLPPGMPSSSVKKSHSHRCRRPMIFLATPPPLVCTRIAIVRRAPAVIARPAAGVFSAGEAVASAPKGS